MTSVTERSTSRPHGGGLRAAMAASLTGYWERRTPAQTFLYAVGAALVAVGVVHLGVFAVGGGPWEGPLSWRKPITFGLSFGVTTLAVAWIATFLRLGRRAGAWLLGTFNVAMALEVAWVTLQVWRGVPSHSPRMGSTRCSSSWPVSPSPWSPSWSWR